MALEKKCPDERVPGGTCIVTPYVQILREMAIDHWRDVDSDYLELSFANRLHGLGYCILDSHALFKKTLSAVFDEECRCQNISRLYVKYGWPHITHIPYEFDETLWVRGYRDFLRKYEPSQLCPGNGDESFGYFQCWSFTKNCWVSMDHDILADLAAEFNVIKANYRLEASLDKEPYDLPFRPKAPSSPVWSPMESSFARFGYNSEDADDECEESKDLPDEGYTSRQNSSKALRGKAYLARHSARWAGN